jgi:glutamyl/glutaminyl-tRNA synthetase
LAPDRSKLSKRKGAKAITEYRDAGYLPAALINYLALLGWNPGDNREVMTIDEIIASFDLAKVQKAGAVFDEEKLKWINKQYMLKLSDAEYLAHAKNFAGENISDELFKNCLPVMRDRAQTFGDVATMFTENGELGFAVKAPVYDAKKLTWKGDADPKIIHQTSLHLEKIIELLEGITEFTSEKIKEAVWPYAEKNGKGSVLWPMRFALTGREKSPDPFASAAILGQVEAINRIKHAHNALKTS